MNTFKKHIKKPKKFYYHIKKKNILREPNHIKKEYYFDKVCCFFLKAKTKT